MKHKTLLLSALLALATTTFAQNPVQQNTTVNTQSSSMTIAELTQKAEQGDADAQYNLGLYYANGEGVPQIWLRR